MGPIPSDDGVLCYFLDLYICSYTSSLSALIQSRNRDSGSRSLDHPSVLLVAQTDPSLPTVGGEIQVVQALDTEVTSLISGAATPAAVLDSFQHHRFVQFACHGTLEANKPFEAGFELRIPERGRHNVGYGGRGRARPCGEFLQGALLGFEERTGDTVP